MRYLLMAALLLFAANTYVPVAQREVRIDIGIPVIEPLFPPLGPAILPVVPSDPPDKLPPLRVGLGNRVALSE
jgi:hypothetical protein